MWGGSRSGCGRNKRESDEKRNWSKYKKEAKIKKLEEAAKSSMNLKHFFSSKTVSNERSGENDLEKVVDEIMNLSGNLDEDREVVEEDEKATRISLQQIPSPLPFFANGCKAPGWFFFDNLLAN